MEQYINKATIVAEIERRIASLEGIGSENYLHDNYPEQYAMLLTLKSLKFSIDTLEVKEVDLEKALSDLDREIKDFVTTDEFERDSAIGGHYWAIAKHAFLLGLKVKKGEEV